MLFTLIVTPLAVTHTPSGAQAALDSDVHALPYPTLSPGRLHAHHLVHILVRVIFQGLSGGFVAMHQGIAYTLTTWSMNWSTSLFSALRRPSVVTRTPSAVRSVTSTLASKAVEYALGLQKNSRYSSSRCAASPAREKACQTHIKIV